MEDINGGQCCDLVRGVNWASDSADEKEEVARVDLVRGVNWAPDSADEEDEVGRVGVVRGVNWAPDSTNEEDVMAVLQGDQASESEVRYVMDSMANDTEVPDSQAVNVENIDDVAQALLDLSSTVVDEFYKHAHEVSALMLPILLPSLYGEHSSDVNDLAANLLWFSHGYIPSLYGDN